MERRSRNRTLDRNVLDNETLSLKVSTQGEENHCQPISSDTDWPEVGDSYHNGHSDEGPDDRKGNGSRVQKPREHPTRLHDDQKSWSRGKKAEREKRCTSDGGETQGKSERATEET